MHARAELILTGRPRDVREARDFVFDTLLTYGITDGLTHDAVLVTSELVTNAVMHGLTPTTVSIDISARAITISVSDLGDAQVRPRHASLTDEGGRGLQIVGELASDWHVVRLNGGKTVIANLPLPAPDGAP